MQEWVGALVSPGGKLENRRRSLLAANAYCNLDSAPQGLLALLADRRAFHTINSLRDGLNSRESDPSLGQNWESRDAFAHKIHVLSPLPQGATGQGARICDMCTKVTHVVQYRNAVAQNWPLVRSHAHPNTPVSGRSTALVVRNAGASPVKKLVHARTDMLQFFPVAIANTSDTKIVG
eukprot:11057003-Alexandrium_andersonii.AAC.1